MRTKNQRGGALLAVLWLTAALSTIAFSVAMTVRGEVDRASTANDSIKSYYLATGAIDRAALWMVWAPSYMQPDGTSRYYNRGLPSLTYTFDSGVATVNVIPENSKLNINSATPEQIFKLLIALGADPDKARGLTAGILDWRTGAPGTLTPFDQFYVSMTPSFRARHASLEEIEELLLVKGMTPELFYGTFTHDAQGRLVPRNGLRDCVSVFGATSRFEVNSATPELLASVGLSEGQIGIIRQFQKNGPIRTALTFAQLSDAIGPQAANQLSYGGSSIFTLRATGRLKRSDGSYSDLRRSVASVVKIIGMGADPAYQTLRWYDNVWQNQAPQ